MKDIIKDRIEKIENNIVPQGYKKTEIGIIPEDWKVEKLGEISETFSGGTPSVGNSIYYGGHIPFIRSGEIYLDKTELYITEDGLKNSSAKMVKKGYILYALYGATSGEVSISKIDGAINQAILAIIPLEKHDNYFICEWLKFNKKSIVSTYLQGGQGNLSGGIIKKINLPIPPLKEQEKIASILSTWDQYIENIDSIIESKKKQKKGLMQNLLTGEVRLPGFNGEWKEVKLGDVIKEVNKKTTKNNEYEILSVTKDGIIPQNKYFTKQIASKNNKGYKIVKEGNLVFSTMNLWMGSLDILKGIEIGIVSPAYKVFKIDIENFDILFLNDFMKTNRMIYLYNINSEQGASVVRRNLDLDSLLSSRINLPPIDEQVAIASVLSSADREIELLEDLRNKRMEEKKGLMQLLLTGIVRVGG